MSFYRQYEATIGKKNIPLASTTYGLGRENAVLSAPENSGIMIATSFFDDLGTDAAREFVRKYKAFSGETDYIGEYAEYGYRGAKLWAAAVEKAGNVKPDDVARALDGVQVAGPGGIYKIDGPTHHVSMDIHIAVGNGSGSFDVIKSFRQQPPADLQAVCDLNKNPGDTTQYEPRI
ncbi:urea ABC transporter, substrate-binding protein [compost metagenome]